MWTLADQKFLRSLRITPDAQPPPLPRFRVEAGTVDGEYHVIDQLRKYRVAFVFGVEWKGKARAAAEQLAGELNEKHLSR